MLNTNETANRHQVTSASGTDLAAALAAINPSKVMQSFSFLPDNYFASLTSKMITVSPMIEDGTLKLFNLKLSRDHPKRPLGEMLGFYFTVNFEEEEYEVNAKCSIPQFEALNKAIQENPSLVVTVKVTEGKLNDTGTKPVYFEFKPNKTTSNIAQPVAPAAEQTVN